MPAALLAPRPGCCVTFTLDEVERGEPLKTVTPRMAIAGLLEASIQECSATTGTVVEVWANPLAMAVELAYAQHHPLVLGPDAIWIAVLQGLSQHVGRDPERWRDRLVAHQGKRTLTVSARNLDWPRIVDGFAGKIAQPSRLGWLDPLRKAAPVVTDGLFMRFSTTGAVERMAQTIALMDLFAPYHDYEIRRICGIPEVSLAGTAADWRLLRERVHALPDFDLEWWYRPLRAVIDGFAEAAAGHIDLGHWRGMYSLDRGMCRQNSDGWFLHLFPYLRDVRTGRIDRRNPLLSGDDAKGGVGVRNLPLCGEVEVTVQNSDGSTQVMILAAGTLAVSVVGGALSPLVAWAVHERHQRTKAADE